MEKNLGQTVNNADSERLAEKAVKANPFLSKTPIVGSENIIDIPQGARVRKEKSGYVLFYGFEPHTANGFEQLPDEAKQIQYKSYKKHGERHIAYGEPTVYDEQGNTI